MDLLLVTEKEEAIKGFESFKENFSKGARIVKNVIGWQGGSEEFDVLVHEAPPVWAVLQPKPPKSVYSPRFWFCFGSKMPEGKKMLSIIVEINPPHQGINKRLGGVFLKDNSGEVFLAHTGKVGGGREGIGAASFSEYYEAKSNIRFQTSFIPELGKKVMIMGAVKARGTIEQISSFVKVVHDYKALSAGGR